MNRRALITGGAGFIGTNVAAYLLQRGYEVTILDNLEREGAKRNATWLSGLQLGKLRIKVGDIRDAAPVRELVDAQSIVFHFAAQVAVTTSVLKPREDADVNIIGTLNVLEALRALPEAGRPVLLFTSTNKVYGRLQSLGIVEHESRYEYRGLDGVSEAQPLDFCSPYGCSKGAADQYVLDYSRIYGLPTVVFRMSCIYGPRQFGTEDQGWVAHFLISAARRAQVTLFGNGKQLRDILFIDDLVECFWAAFERIDDVKGEAFNIGGGPNNTISLLELLDWLNNHAKRPVEYEFKEWRPGDQPVYVSDIAKANQRLGWRPRTDVSQGLERLWAWIQSSQGTY